MFWRLFLSNASALLVAFAFLAFGPVTVSHPPQPREFGLLVLGLAALLLINAAVAGQVLRGTESLQAALSSDGEEPVDVPAHAAPELRQVASAYNAMLHRLETERTATARAALRAQEEERSRLARDLHDEVGQNLTFLLLRLNTATKKAPPDLTEDLDAVADAARAALEEIRTLSQQLRPGVLNDLGLKPALASLLNDAQHFGLATELEFRERLPPDAERDLVVYRVVQESLTNVVKHASASSVRVTVGRRDPHLVVEIADDGNGRSGPDGTGSSSMRERARLVGGTFRRDAVLGTGTRVTLGVPLSVSSDGEGPPTRPIPRLSYFPPHTWNDPTSS